MWIGRAGLARWLAQALRFAFSLPEKAVGMGCRKKLNTISFAATAVILGSLWH